MGVASQRLSAARLVRSAHLVHAVCDALPWRRQPPVEQRDRCRTGIVTPVIKDVDSTAEFRVPHTEGVDFKPDGDLVHNDRQARELFTLCVAEDILRGIVVYACRRRRRLPLIEHRLRPQRPHLASPLAERAHDGDEKHGEADDVRPVLFEQIDVSRRWRRQRLANAWPQRVEPPSALHEHPGARTLVAVPSERQCRAECGGPPAEYTPSREIRWSVANVTQYAIYK
eukprot:2547534-Prymnesium_polylepis.1